MRGLEQGGEELAVLVLRIREKRDAPSQLSSLFSSHCVKKKESVCMFVMTVGKKATAFPH